MFPSDAVRDKSGFRTHAISVCSKSNARKFLILNGLEKGSNAGRLKKISWRELFGENSKKINFCGFYHNKSTIVQTEGLEAQFCSNFSSKASKFFILG